MVENDAFRKARAFSRAVDKIKELEMYGQNRETSLEFINYCLTNGMSKVRLLRYMCLFRKLNKHLGKDFKDVDILDIRGFVGEIQLNENYKPWTRYTYKVCLKRFYKYLNGDQEYPDTVNWIKCAIKKNEINLPSEGELISEDEVKKLIDYSRMPRDKAFISVLWESGCRIGELANIKIKNVTFDEHGFTINVKGKTGMRRIKLISSTTYLSTWLDNHPYKNNPEMSLWVKTYKDKKDMSVGYAGFSKILDRAFKNAGLNKRKNPHFFRHSRATFMANHLTEFQMNQYFGWVQGSGMPSTYVHMSGREIDNKILELHGIQSRKDEISKHKPKICPKCNVINNSDTKLCINCAFILDEVEAMKIQKQKEGEVKGNELMNELMKDPEVLKLISKKISEMGLFGKISG